MRFRHGTGICHLYWRAAMVACGALLVAAPAPAHLGDLVFCDANGNGVFEPPADVGIPNVAVILTCPGGSQTQVTNANGRYLFVNVPLVACTVQVDASTLPASAGSITTPLLGVRPLPTAEHSPFPGYSEGDPGVVCGSAVGPPSSDTTSVVANGIFSTLIDNLASCQDPACITTSGPGPDPCIVNADSPPFYGYYGDDFGFQCAASPTRPPIPVVQSPTGLPGLALVAGLAAAMWLSLRRLRRSA